MDLKLFESKSALKGTGKDLPHLAGPSASVRQVLAAHFVRDCPHIIEIGGHIRPITPFLTHRPQSVLVVDPKTDPYEADTLNDAPCRVRHVAKKFQEIGYDYAPHSYGLVMLGYSLKPFGRHEPLGELLYSLIDRARVVVVEYPPELDRASSQVPHILARPGIAMICNFELILKDDEIAASPYARREFIVFHQTLGDG